MTAPEQQAAPGQQPTWPPPAGTRVTATGTCCGQTLAEIRFTSTGDPEQRIVVPGCPNSARMPHEPHLTFTWVEDEVEWQAAPEQADLRQRLTDALDNAHRTNPCTCGAIYYYTCFHEGALSHTERRTAAVLAELQPELAELAALREQHTATQAENERLRAELGAWRGHAKQHASRCPAGETCDWWPVESLDEHLARAHTKADLVEAVCDLDSALHTATGPAARPST